MPSPALAPHPVPQSPVSSTGALIFSPASVHKQPPVSSGARRHLAGAAQLRGSRRQALIERHEHEIEPPRNGDVERIVRAQRKIKPSDICTGKADVRGL